ncbi:MAG: DUF3810 domain-containing protein [Clostridiales bacterium]|nr:DUF3810 domain-containing protein [Candidatus Scatonaster coprocaballi]
MTKKQFLKKWGIGIILPILLIILLYVIQSILVHFPNVCEGYSKTVFGVLSFLPVKLSSIVPISLTEVFVVSLVFSAPFLIAWLVIRIVRACKKKEGKKFFFRNGRILAWSVAVIYLLFMLLHGMNYTRCSLDDELGFGVNHYSVEEVKEAFVWVVDELNACRMNCPEDEAGVLTYPDGIEAFLNDMPDIYQNSAKYIPQIKGNAGRPKPVMLSHYWSYTNIVGMYFPFFGEANINTDLPFPAIPMNVCHEMSHVHGYAVENDANLAAMLIGFYSDCPQVRYAAFCEAMDLILLDLVVAYNGNNVELDAFLSEHPVCMGYFRDQEAIAEYWEGINPPKIIEQASSAVNDTYLKANQQDEGEKSYQMPTSTVTDFYMIYVRSQLEGT